ncbi:MAG: hypothetical protein AVO38_06115 [delta proteobacterium ML8_D]|nr:MAG: hypothetical protein AVO38_06115 [delta proteobacterium ML8_D]
MLFSFFSPGWPTEVFPAVLVRYNSIIRYENDKASKLAGGSFFIYYFHFIDFCKIQALLITAVSEIISMLFTLPIARKDKFN